MVFWNQDGLVVGDGYSSKRHNARISVNTEVYDRLKLTGQMSYVDFYKKDLGYSGYIRSIPPVTAYVSVTSRHVANS